VETANYMSLIALYRTEQDTNSDTMHHTLDFFDSKDVPKQLSLQLSLKDVESTIHYDSDLKNTNIVSHRLTDTSDYRNLKIIHLPSTST
jgi:hypothetical protein